VIEFHQPITTILTMILVQLFMNVVLIQMNVELVYVNASSNISTKYFEILRFKIFYLRSFVGCFIPLPIPKTRKPCTIELNSNKSS